VSTEEETVFRQTMDRHGSVQGMKSELYRCDGLPVEVLISADRINIGNEEKQLFRFSDLTRTNQLERELITMQKFESIGLLAGGIAHDFNNLLTAIMGNISLAKEEIPPTEDSIIESLDLALAACNHASQLTGQLLTFSKSDVTHSAVISVIEAVEQSVRLALSGTEIETVIDDSDNRLKVRADRGELVQVFNNLLINAKQAMPDGGRVSITIRRYVHPEGGRYSTNAPMSLKNGEYVRVSVSDNGPGIPRNRLPHLFDPYFTTKPSGSGLGLSIVYSLLKKYGGEVTVQSRKGAGSTFNVFFPAIAEAAEERSAAGQTASDFSGIVLLMDDEESIRRVGAQLLAQLGCTVFTDSNGEALLERVAELRKQGIEPDAVILDLTVAAGLNGLQTAEALRSVIPRVPIILTTGHTEHEILEDYSSYGFDDYLVKPFAREHLAEVLARHLPYGACIDEETV
jgi:signal transduction histidine kinase/CheY-like chemotaxis protein